MNNISDIKDLNFLNGYQQIDCITDGWSKDIKFRLSSNDNESKLLRLSSMETYDKKKDHFESLSPLKNSRLPISKPLDFGTCFYKNIEYCYTLFSWLEGDMAQDVLLSYSKQNQYEFGYRAGEILKELHSIPIQDKYKTINWELLFNKKLDRNIQMAKECSVKYNHQENIISYIESNRHLLESRPITFQHGDYHIGNMLINNNELGIIDFNRQDHGDPWEEFNRITWCSSVSPEFATGRIDGYFKNEVPEKFFKLLALYIASNQLSSVPWAIPFGQKQVDIMLSEVKKVIASYNNFDACIPKWYRLKKD